MGRTLLRATVQLHCRPSSYTTAKMPLKLANCNRQRNGAKLNCHNEHGVGLNPNPHPSRTVPDASKIRSSSTFACSVDKADMRSSIGKSHKT